MNNTLSDSLWSLAVENLRREFPQPKKPEPIGPVVAGIDLGDECQCIKCQDARARALLELEARR